MPDVLGPAALELLALSESGVLEEVGRRLRVVREGGYVGLDVFIFLVSYFYCGENVGLRAFYERAREAKKELAALGGRRSLMTPSSVSRLLSAVEAASVRKLSSWLLVEASGVLDVLRHPWVQTRDARGEGWHVFERDGRVHALRHRALPEDETRPAARRRSDDIAAPGYSGRKRGDVQVHRTVLQHGGSGAYLNLRIAPGNGERRTELAADLAVLRGVVAQLGVSPKRTLLRMDGEFGWVPSLSLVREAGIPCITRITRPGLLDQLDVRRRLVEGTWCRVPDSGSGPMRSAMDLGLVTLRPDRASVREDGTPFEPIELRAVVSRYPREGSAEHGRVIEGWQYELFAAMDLEADAWPAPDVVAMYFGRSSQENRFIQEDREVHLQRIFSYCAAGQELATLIGLFTWNRALACGFKMAPPPEEMPKQPPRRDETDPRPVPETTATVEAVPQPQPPPPDLLAQTQEALDHANAALAELTDALDWNHLLRRRVGGWRYLTGEGLLACPANRRLAPTSVGSMSRSRKMRIHYIASAGTCTDCPRRAGCLNSVRPGATKLTCFLVAPDVALPIQERLQTVHLLRRKLRSVDAMTNPPPNRDRRPPKGTPLPLRPCEDVSPGAYATDGPFLAPAVARRRFREASRQLQVRVRLHLPAVPKPNPLFLPSASQRQRRRLSWQARTERYALPDGSDLEVVIEAKAEVLRRLGLPVSGSAAA
ncbi:MAG: hypothetical protein H6739_00975 [Alphaproteobacteria bacterium]|nr:hypothetical protein [Alphaproteobacteria bacterium]